MVGTSSWGRRVDRPDNYLEVIWRLLFGNLVPSLVDSIHKRSYLEAVDGRIASSSSLSFTHAKNHVDWTAGCGIIHGFVG